MEPFRIHVADEVLDDLRARLRQAGGPTRYPASVGNRAPSSTGYGASFPSGLMSSTGMPESGDSTRSTTLLGKASTSCTSARHPARKYRSSSHTAGPAVSSTMWTCCRCSTTERQCVSVAAMRWPAMWQVWSALPSETTEGSANLLIKNLRLSEARGRCFRHWTRPAIKRLALWGR